MANDEKKSKKLSDEDLELLVNGALGNFMGTTLEARVIALETDFMPRDVCIKVFELYDQTFKDMSERIDILERKQDEASWSF